jgi:histidyl-tRNA synthetase
LIEQCGGEPTPAIGFSMGIERTIKHLYADPVDPQRSRQSLVDVYVVCLGEAAQQYGMVYADLLRGSCRVEVDTTGRAAKSQMKTADSRGARVVLIAGDDEIAQEVFQLKDLSSGEQSPVGCREILTAVREVLAR